MSAPAHVPYWNPVLQEDYCHTDGEPWPCLHYRQNRPPKCKCSHGASTHTGGYGQCWTAACGCRTYRDPNEVAAPRRLPEHLRTDDINDYLRQKGEIQ